MKNKTFIRLFSLSLFIITVCFIGIKIFQDNVVIRDSKIQKDGIHAAHQYIFFKRNVKYPFNKVKKAKIKILAFNENIMETMPIIIVRAELLMDYGITIISQEYIPLSGFTTAIDSRTVVDLLTLMRTNRRVDFKTMIDLKADDESVKYLDSIKYIFYNLTEEKIEINMANGTFEHTFWFGDQTEEVGQMAIDYCYEYITTKND